MLTMLFCSQCGAQYGEGPCPRCGPEGSIRNEALSLEKRIEVAASYVRRVAGQRLRLSDYSIFKLKISYQFNKLTLSCSVAARLGLDLEAARAAVQDAWQEWLKENQDLATMGPVPPPLRTSALPNDVFAANMRREREHLEKHGIEEKADSTTEDNERVIYDDAFDVWGRAKA